MATHRGAARRGVLVRMGGVGLIAAGILAAGTAYADAGSGPDVLNNITSVLDGVTGTRPDAAAGDTGGGAHATLTGGGRLDSDDNAGDGAGNQADVHAQAPVSVDCNGVTVLGAALATCPADEATYGPTYGGGYGSGGPGGGYGTPETPKNGPDVTPGPKDGGKTPHVLAATGNASGALGLAGGALLLTGAGLVMVGRRPARRRGAHCA